MSSVSPALSWFGSSKSRPLRLLLGFGLTLGLLLYCLSPLYSFGDYGAVIRFADTRSWLGIESFSDVLSNIGFIFIGFWGIAVSLKGLHSQIQIDRTHDWALALMLFISIFLTGLGSGYFHLNPSNQTLIWDRLPMVMGFSALVGLLVSDRFTRATGRAAFFAMILMGAASIFFWIESQSATSYSVLQAATILICLGLPIFFPVGRIPNRAIYLAVGTYAIAKIFELGDALIFQATGLVGGHALKHLMAALAMLFILKGLNQKEVRS